ncbi:MAG: 6-phosphogluconolactonase [Anaerolineaceae bacterium]|nr:6-phosphogluconolactonase [Anaerolineaceae bacterium]
MQKIEIYETQDQLFRSAAAIFYTLAEKAAQYHRNIYVGLSGGGTPNKLYPYLIQQKELLLWEKVEVYFSDERLVSLENGESNHYQASQNLLNLVEHPLEQRYSPDVTLNAVDASKQYEALILDNVPKKNGLPYFDIILLGLGDDGHTASLFPNQIGDEIFDDLIIPAEAKYQNRPSARISMTPKLINNAANVIFLLSGQEKAQAVYHSLMEGQDWRIWPASSINGDKNDVFWFMDEAAAKHLEMGSG